MGAGLFGILSADSCICRYWGENSPGLKTKGDTGQERPEYGCEKESQEENVTELWEKGAIKSRKSRARDQVGFGLARRGRHFFLRYEGKVNTEVILKKMERNLEHFKLDFCSLFLKM